MLSFGKPWSSACTYMYMCCFLFAARWKTVLLIRWFANYSTPRCNHIRLKRRDSSNSGRLMMMLDVNTPLFFFFGQEWSWLATPGLLWNILANFSVTCHHFFFGGGRGKEQKLMRESRNHVCECAEHFYFFLPCHWSRQLWSTFNIFVI